MKKRLLTSLFAISSAAVLSAAPAVEEPVDTVLDVRNADIVVSQDEDGLTIDVKPENGEATAYVYPYAEGTAYAVERTYTNPATLFSRHNFSIGFSGFSVGFVKALDAPRGMGQEMGKSLEFSLDQILSFQWHLPGHRDMLAIGIGVDWRNYRMTDSQRFMLRDKVVKVEGWEEGQNPVDSRLKTFGLQFPVSYVHTFNSYAKVGLAVIMNVNTYGSLKSHYTDTEGKKFETFQKCSGEINRFTVDFKATVQFCPFVALYCKYSPMKVFKKERGPEFTPLSAGFTFFY